jgi:uncharacterized iron-regulated membrane protein
MTRAFWVWLHRWAGLAMAGFLIVVGSTGSVLAFLPEINHWLTPDLYPGERAGIELDAATLARRAESIVPEARATTVYLGYPGSVEIGMKARAGAPALDFDYLHLDPIDGTERGRVRSHGLPKTKNDIMPFIYAIHKTLAIGAIGDWMLGAVAAIWTLDCFVAFYLTSPPLGERARKGFLARWKPSWRVKLSGSFYRVNFDLHRASGLWLWAILLVFAWSSVFFTLPGFYTSVTRRLFDFEPPGWARVATPQSDARRPMEWEEAQATGERLMADQARAHDFTIERPLALYNRHEKGFYEYRVRSSRDIGDTGGATSILFDSHSGELKTSILPTGHRGGVTLTTWLVELRRRHAVRHGRLYLAEETFGAAGACATGGDAAGAGGGNGSDVRCRADICARSGETARLPRARGARRLGRGLGIAAGPGAG